MNYLESKQEAQLLGNSCASCFIFPDKVVISYLYFFARCYLKDFLIGVPLSFLYGYGIQTCSFVTIGMDHK